jgi:hypothetical protein
VNLREVGGHSRRSYPHRIPTKKRVEEATVKLSIGLQEQLAQVFVAAVTEATAAIAADAVSFAALEAAMETAVRQAGAAGLTQLLAAVGHGYDGPTRRCACGAHQTTDHYATSTRQTVMGTVTLRRAAYHCPTCGRHERPFDARLAVPTGHLSTQLATRLSLLSALLPFAEARDVLARLTGVEVSAKTTQVVSEALGATVAVAQDQPDPVGPCAAAVPDRVYLGMDGVMYGTVERDPEGKLVWHEAKVGVFYTARPTGTPGTGRHSRLAPDGMPIDVAEADSQSYVVHMGNWQDFAGKVWREGERRGWWQAREIIVLGDGAKWITTLTEELRGGLEARVVQILDLRHAEEHLWAAAHACLSEAESVRWVQGPLEELRLGQVDAVVAALQSLPTPTAEAAKLVVTTAAYYTDRREQMRYPAFRAEGMQIGSGLAESGCKRLVGQRAKGPGMHWTVDGAQAISTLRAAYLSRRWDEVEHIAQAA